MVGLMLRLLKILQLVIVLVVCTTLVLLVSPITKWNYPTERYLEMWSVTSTTTDEGETSTITTESPFRPLSVKYNGTPISELYHPGFDIDPVACHDGGTDLQLVVVVHTSHKNEEQRMAIRHTWGSLNFRNDAVVVFLLGKSLDENLNRRVQMESQLYRDIVVSRNVDTYNNLTLKSIAMSEWISSRCPEAKFFLKADDDLFLNVPRLLELLQKPEVSAARRTVFGGMTRGTHPVRAKGHRHYISEDEYPENTYIDYFQGACYLITGDLSRDLYRASLQEKFFRMEDVFFTGLMAEKVGARKVGQDDIYSAQFMLKRSKKNGNVPDPCVVRSKIGIHYIYVEQMFILWHNVYDRTLKC